MKLLGEQQMNFFWNYDLEQLVSAEHKLRKIAKIVSFSEIAKKFSDLESDAGRKGYGVEVGIKCLFLQFFYDLSDREAEEDLRDNNAFKWFVGFKLDEETPDHSYFCRFRKTLGEEKTASIFKMIVEQSKAIGILKNLFTFVDATVIKVKETTWEERDKAIKQGEEALNNSNIENYSADKDARFGCKGKKKFFFGYKSNASVDTQSGLIKDTIVTPGNTPDSKAFKDICPEDSVILADKGYATKEVEAIIEEKNCHSFVIKKNNMKNKNKDKDRWITGLRSAYERVFGTFSKKTKYRGISKVSIQNFWECIVFNIKRLVVLNSPPIFAGA